MTRGRDLTYREPDFDDSDESVGEIRNLHDLAREVLGEVPDEGIEKRIAQRLYKDTECGISFFVPEGSWGVTVSGYAEGTDAECSVIELRYPFTADAFWVAVQEADQEGCELFHATQDEGEEADEEV